MCCTYRVVLWTNSRSIVNMTAWGSCTLTHFDRQFLPFLVVANFFYTMMTHSVIDMVEFSIRYHITVCTETVHGAKSHGSKCVKETSSEWPT